MKRGSSSARRASGCPLISGRRKQRKSRTSAITSPRAFRRDTTRSPRISPMARRSPTALPMSAARAPQPTRSALWKRRCTRSPGHGENISDRCPNCRCRRRTCSKLKTPTYVTCAATRMRSSPSAPASSIHSKGSAPRIVRCRMRGRYSRPARSPQVVVLFLTCFNPGGWMKPALRSAATSTGSPFVARSLAAP